MRPLAMSATLPEIVSIYNLNYLKLLDRITVVSETQDSIKKRYNFNSTEV